MGQAAYQRNLSTRVSRQRQWPLRLLPLCLAPLFAVTAIAQESLDQLTTLHLSPAPEPKPASTATPPGGGEGPASSISSAVRQTYAPEQFDRFAPRSALDMVRQVPGFAIREGGDSRGFGQADTNVLINGRRISGKSNGPVEALGRITAGDVTKLEIVDGASLDIGGLSGQVLNVVTSSGSISGRFRLSPQYRTDHVHFRPGDAEFSLSGGKERSEWTFRLRNEQRYRGDEGPESVFNDSGELIETRQETRREDYDQPGIAGSYTGIQSNGNVLNLTGEVNGFFRDFREESRRNSFADGLSTRHFRDTEDEYNFELGADYEFSAPGGRLKFIGLHRFEHSPTVSDARFEFPDERPPQGSEFSRDADEAESILRGEYIFKALGGDMQWSLEAVRNYLEIDATLDRRDENGVLQPVDFPASSSRVEEDRAETTVSYGRALLPTLQLQSSIGVEYSEITQSGEFGQVRSFVRPNGFLALNWRPNDATIISGRLERVVGQLNFFDFIASVNVNQDRVNVTNVDLVPPQSWLADIEVQQSLGGYGTATLRGFFEDISDIVDQIPIEGGGQAPGNIDSATRYGASLDVTLLSDPTGWRGARFDLSVDYVDSEVIDPLLGSSREISGDDYLDIRATFRRDLPNTDWAGGFNLNYEEDYLSVRLDEESQFLQTRPFVDSFVEHKDVYGMTMRLTVGNLVGRKNAFSRTIYRDRRANEVAFSEDRKREFGTIVRFEVEGSF